MDFQLVLPLWKILDRNFVIPKLRGTKPSCFFLKDEVILVISYEL